VASPGKGMQLDRIQLASKLWAADIAAEFGYKANPNFKDSLQYADDEGIPFVVILGESEKQEVRVHCACRRYFVRRAGHNRGGC
jgi:histidyl-tRNA synthetase